MEMTWKIAFVVSIWLSPAVGRAGWSYLYSELGDGNAIVDVSMANERVGCAVGVHKPGGSSGNTAPLTICTTDGGSTWRNVTLDSGMLIPTSVFVFDDTFWFVGAVKISGFNVTTKIYGTTDGAGWSEAALPSDAKGTVNDLFFLDRVNGWAATDDGLLKTVDGGDSWTWLAIPELGDGRVVEGVFFIDPMNGWIVGGKAFQQGDEWSDPVPACCGFILHTNDGGESWNFQEDELSKEVHRVAFVDGQSGLVAGGGSGAGLLMRTEDGGQSWTSVTIAAGQNGIADYISDIAWSGAQKAWAVGNRGDGNPMVFKSVDSALNWTVDESYEDAFAGLSGFEAFAKYSMLIAMSFPSEGTGMVGGKNALLVGYVGDGFCPDMDGDGHQDESCGGDDCDDQNRYVNPSADELCNGLDENCDGVADESFDLNTDHSNCGECGFGCQPAQVCWDGNCTMDCPEELTRCGQDCVNTSSSVRHCGGCDESCIFGHAGASCEDGNCVMGDCSEGWIDLDGLESNGCEYECVPSEPATEICNGVDDDCDGVVDEDLDCGDSVDGGMDGGTSQGDRSDISETALDTESTGCGCTTRRGPGSLLLVLLMLAVYFRETRNW